MPTMSLSRLRDALVTTANALEQIAARDAARAERLQARTTLCEALEALAQLVDSKFDEE